MDRAYGTAIITQSLTMLAAAILDYFRLGNSRNDNNKCGYSEKNIRELKLPHAH